MLKSLTFFKSEKLEKKISPETISVVQYCRSSSTVIQGSFYKCINIVERRKMRSVVKALP